MDRTDTKACAGVLLVVLVGAFGCGDDDAGLPAQAEQSPATEAPADDGGGADPGFPTSCPGSDDIGARLGVTVELEPDVLLDPDPPPEVECRYEWRSADGIDQGSLEVMRQRMDSAGQASHVVEGWGRSDDREDPEIDRRVTELDLGDEALVTTSDYEPVEGEELDIHNAVAVIRVDAWVCLGDLQTSWQNADVPAPNEARDTTATDAASTLCGVST